MEVEDVSVRELRVYRSGPGCCVTGHVQDLRAGRAKRPTMPSIRNPWQVGSRIPHEQKHRSQQVTDQCTRRTHQVSVL